MKTQNSREIVLLSNCLHFHAFTRQLHDSITEISTNGLWPHLIERALCHVVAPRLYRQAVRMHFLEHIPSDAAEFLRLADSLNGLRNKNMRDQMLHFVEALDEAGITVVPIKGAAILLDSPQNDCIMMSDIDVLVPSSEFGTAIKVAACLGYKSAHSAGQHSAVLENPEHVATIDLHVDLGPQQHVLAAHEAIARAERILNLTLWQLCPTDRVIHNIYHAQIQNRNYKLGIVSLHQLCNFGLLVGAHEDRIDWDFVALRFEEQGYRSAFRSYLYAADRLLGIQTPLSCDIGHMERIHFRRMMVQLDWRWVYKLVTYISVLALDMTEDRVSYRRAKGDPIGTTVGAWTKVALGAVGCYRLGIFRKIWEVHRRRFGDY
jgi:hypothetical protein